MANGLAYTLGKHWKLTGIAVIAAIAAGCWPEKTTPPAAAPTAIQAAPQASCIENKNMLAAYAQHLGKHEYWKAARTISPCAESTGNPELIGKVKAAEAASYAQDIENTKLSAFDRLQAAERLRELDPLQADKFKSITTALEAQQNKALENTKKKQLAQQKSEGVRIGMTPEEVFLSSWGKPVKINRTTTAHGTREQWVYEGHHYLYFTDGKLHTIQD